MLANRGGEATRGCWAGLRVETSWGGFGLSTVIIFCHRARKERLILDRDIFRANLNILHQIYPEIAKKLESFEYGSSPQYTIEPHSERGWTCVDNTLPPGEQIVHGPDDPWAVAEKQAAGISQQETELFVIYRCGLGYLPHVIYPQLRGGRYAQRLLITEDRWEILASSFWLLDWTDVLRSDRVILLFGENAGASIMDFFVTNPIGMLPPIKVIPGSNCTENDQKVMEVLNEKMQEMGEKIRSQTEGFLSETLQHYENRREELSENTGSPMKVLFVEPEHEYLAENMIAGLRDLGHESDKFTGNLRMLHFINTWLWLVYVREHYPDILLWMNRNSLSPVGKKFLDKVPITKAIWYLDNPARVKVSREEMDATDVVFTFDENYIPLLKEMGAKSVHTLHNPAGLLPTVRLDDNPPPRKGPEVGFVGALAAQRFQPVREFWLQRDPDYVHILDGIVDDFLKDPSTGLEERYKNSEAIQRLPYEGFPVLYLEERTTYLRRYHYLEAIKDLGLETYGAPEWADAEMAKELVPCYAGHGPEYVTELPQVYYDTKININIFHIQCIDSPNPRIFDVLACGGFLITEHRPSLEKYFQHGVELCWFKSREELVELVTYYREHPEEREEIARQGQKKALAEHLAKNRMQEFMDTIQPERKT